MPPFKNILVVRTDRIGDVILTVPALRALRQAYPEARLTVLLRPLTRELVEGLDCVDAVLCDDRQQRHRGAWGYARLVRSLARQHFDLAVNFHTKKRTNLLCYLAGIPRRLGYKNEKWGFLLTDPVYDDRPQGNKHEAAYCLDLLQSLGIKSQDLHLDLPVSPAGERWADTFLETSRKQETGPWIAVHMQSSCPTKQWPANFFAELLRILQEKYQANFIIIGAKARQDNAAAASFSELPSVDARGQTGIAQLISLLRRCRMLISNDSGPVHMAAALGIPVVSIFTRNQPGINPQRWRPLGPKSRCVAPPLDMSPSFARGRIEDAGYLDKVSVSQVLAAVDELWELC